MNQKLQELTDKIYEEGVEKGEEKGLEIIRNAEERAEKIIAEAHSSGKSIIGGYEREARALKKKVESEISLLGKQSIIRFKQQIVDVITAKAVEENVSAIMASPENIAEFAKTIIQNWNYENSESPSLELLLPENKKKELEVILKAEVYKSLSEEVTIRFSNAVKGGFSVGPQDGSYKVSLSDENFKDFFKTYLKPKTRQLLFGE